MKTEYLKWQREMIEEKEQSFNDLKVLRGKEKLGKTTGRNVNPNLIKDLGVSVKPCKILKKKKLTLKDGVHCKKSSIK